VDGNTSQEGRVHLVGSINLASTEDVLRACGATLKDELAAVPDGEMNYRRAWIHHLAYTVYYPNLDLVVRNRPGPANGQVSWYARTQEEQWVFEVRRGCSKVELRDLGYAAAAEDAYGLLLRLREEGVVSPETRLQVALPFPDDGVGAFFHDDRSFKIVADAYREALKREIDALVAVVPASEISVQWDVCFEVFFIEGVVPWDYGDDPWARYISNLKELGALVPEEALMGYHFCYGNWEGKHWIEPNDLGLCVRMANAAGRNSGRRVDFAHMPVPISRDDDPYFVPLDDLEDDIGRVYLGLVHEADGLEGARRRVHAAQKHLASFGVSTECGMGRREQDLISPLLELHRRVADDLLAEVL
jgi:hypothetical protein